MPQPDSKKNFRPTVPMVVNEISRLFDERMRRTTTEPLQTQSSCRMLLRVLSHMEGCTQLDLVRATLLKPPTVSVALKKLEQSGFVRRETDADDLRAIHVYLTEKGHALNRATIARLKSNDAILMEGITEAEQEELLQLLTKMRDNMLCALESEREI
ncbi:MAG: MarR family transcriptional regulator [Clostridia bacterium]|nr:MarR family transcriptional regulator [Clostridia bacterium]